MNFSFSSSLLKLPLLSISLLLTSSDFFFFLSLTTKLGLYRLEDLALDSGIVLNFSVVRNKDFLLINAKLRVKF